MKTTPIISVLILCFICCKPGDKSSMIVSVSEKAVKSKLETLECGNLKIAFNEIENYKLLWKLPLTQFDNLGIPNCLTLKSTAKHLYEEVYTVGIFPIGYMKSKVIQFDKTTVLLPIRFRNCSKFSFWHLEKDSLEFVKFLKPITGGTYQIPLIDTVIVTQNKTLIIGQNRGGEGGDIWDELWVKEITKADTLITLKKMNYNFNGFMKEQAYFQEVISNKLIQSVYIDSVNGLKDTLISEIDLEKL